MQQKLLRGASREALAFMLSHWQDLAKISVIPILAYVVLTYVQLTFMADFYRSMGSMVDGQNIDPQFFGTYMRNMGLIMLGSLVAFVLLGTLFVQIIRFQRSGDAQWLLTDKAGLKAALMTLVYGLGIVMLTFLAYAGGLLALVIVITLLALIFGGPGVVMAVLSFIGALALVAGLCWFMCRFLTGLPGVALGHSPDFFRDMWPLSRGESWGVPLRMLMATLVTYIPLLILGFVFLGDAFTKLVTGPKFETEDPAVMFPAMAEMMEQMAPFTVVAMLVYVPFMWFTSLLLGIAFQKFRAREGVDVKRQRL